MVVAGWCLMELGNKIYLLILIINFVGSPVYAGYTPAEQNPLLGRPVLMDGMTCAQKYGEAFCKCVELEDGTYGCYYSRPATGMYSLERCEQIWGAGHCECNANGECKLKENANQSTPMGCSGQIYIFPGQTEQCRKAGFQTMGNNCCTEETETSNACSFENTAKELGWDDAAISMVQGVGSYFAQKKLAEWGAQYALENALANGAFDFATTSLQKIFGDVAVKYVFNNGYHELSVGGIQYAWTGGAEEISQVAMNAASEQLAATLSSAISMIGWAYTIYSMYNMMNEMTKCYAGEKILGCKIAKGICHEVGTKCAVKIFGSCIQKKKVYCCFDSLLARIIQEQGRKQLGRDWGSGSSPDCRGFYVDEFMRIDFTKFDFGEYTDDVTRQMLNEEQVGDKILKSVQKYESLIPN